MNIQRVAFLRGTITHTCASGEVFTVEMEDGTGEGQGCGNPGAWPRFYFISTKGYCSRDYRSLIPAISEMLRIAKNADFDYYLERDMKK